MELGFIIIGFMLIFYFLPWGIARQRHAQHVDGILLINLFFGWTILGWLAALIWAVSEAPKPPQQRNETNWSEPFYKK